MGTKINLNTKSFAIFDCSVLKQLNGTKLTSQHLFCLIEYLIFLSCLIKLVNTTPRSLNFSIYFNDTPPTFREHWTRFLESRSSSVLEGLIFIPAVLHATAKPFITFWRPDSEEASKTKSFAKTTDITCIFQS